MAFFIVYLVMAKEIWARSDAWLTGEAQVLAQVAQNAPRDRLYNHIVREVAELAMREVPDERSSQGERLNNVFFLWVNPAPNGDILFVGPGSKEMFLRAIQQAHFAVGVPQSIRVNGWQPAFRVVMQDQEGAKSDLLGALGARRPATFCTRSRSVFCWCGPGRSFSVS